MSPLASGNASLLNAAWIFRAEFFRDPAGTDIFVVEFLETGLQMAKPIGSSDVAFRHGSAHSYVMIFVLVIPLHLRGPASEIGVGRARPCA